MTAKPGKRRPGRRPQENPKDQKVTARFSDEEYEQIVALGKRRREKLSSLVRELVLETLDEARGGASESD